MGTEQVSAGRGTLGTEWHRERGDAAVTALSGRCCCCHYSQLAVKPHGALVVALVALGPSDGLGVPNPPGELCGMSQPEGLRRGRGVLGQGRGPAVPSRWLRVTRANVKVSERIGAAALTRRRGRAPGAGGAGGGASPGTGHREGLGGPEIAPGAICDPWWAFGISASAPGGGGAGGPGVVRR